MAEKLYPNLNIVPRAPILFDNDPKEAVVCYTDISDKLNKNLSDARIKEIETKRHELEMNLKHYKKY